MEDRNVQYRDCKCDQPPAAYGARTNGAQIRMDSSLPQPRASLETFPFIEPAAPRGLFPIQLLPGRWVERAVFVWLAASLFMLARLAVSNVLLERRKRRACTLPAHETRLQEWLACCGVGKRKVRLAVSAEIATPVAAGPYRPSILIPARMLDALEEDELDQIGLHEAAHLSRLDDYALVFERILEALFVFHPVVRWIARRLDLEREMACDDVVVRVTGRAAPYASCLTRVVELAGGISASRLAASAADHQSHLERRVEMLLDNTRKTGTRLLKLRLAAAVTVLGLMVWTASEVPNFIVLAAPLQEKPALVRIPVVVTDSLHRYVSGLEREHFKVFEDSAEQDITEFFQGTLLRGGEPALSVAIVFDIRNGNAGGQIAQQTVAQFLGNASPEDEFCFIHFNTQPESSPGFTPDAEEILSRMRSAQTSGPTALLDGVRLGLTELGSARNGRKVLLIVSDGNEHSSPYTADQAGIVASTSDASIYVISLTQLYPSRVSAAGVLSEPALLDTLAEQSGGRHFAIAAGDVPDVSKKIRVELRNTYLLGYQPKNTSRDGKYRQIRVQVLPPRGIQGLTSMTRAGYYASVQGR